MAFWFDGRMSSEGDAGIGDGGICWEAARRDELASKCGDGGTELGSGIATSRSRGRQVFARRWDGCDATEPEPSGRSGGNDGKGGRRRAVELGIVGVQIGPSSEE